MQYWVKSKVCKASRRRLKITSLHFLHEIVLLALAWARAVPLQNTNKRLWNGRGERGEWGMLLERDSVGQGTLGAGVAASGLSSSHRKGTVTRSISYHFSLRCAAGPGMAGT